jgi:hypothetical protein
MCAAGAHHHAQRGYDVLPDADLIGTHVDAARDDGTPACYALLPSPHGTGADSLLLDALSHVIGTRNDGVAIAWTRTVPWLLWRPRGM